MDKQLTIQQVIEACGIAWDAEWRIQISREGDLIEAQIITNQDDYGPSARGDSVEAAIQQLGRDAIAKLREKREAAAAVLRKLGEAD